MTWLYFKMGGDSVSLIRCKICCKFRDRLESIIWHTLKAPLSFREYAVKCISVPYSYSGNFSAVTGNDITHVYCKFCTKCHLRALIFQKFVPLNPPSFIVIHVVIVFCTMLPAAIPAIQVNYNSTNVRKFS